MWISERCNSNVGRGDSTRRWIASKMCCFGWITARPVAAPYTGNPAALVGADGNPPVIGGTIAGTIAIVPYMHTHLGHFIS